MKKVELEKQAIVKALDTAPNITVAARDLGASRRTLQSRMRDHGLAPGDSGRPRQLLPKRSFVGSGAVSSALPVIALVGVVFGAVGWWLWSKRKTTDVVAGVKVGAKSGLVGLDVFVHRRYT